ncbi:Mechanosensitive ion channel-domain-containing protein [Lineolata rhizophorae]|uniref:Mechanosensitive ion channel-domain-containing protein n=1 Tax=Lineolata rhizophorae TaxID=578093 RepID=A0A6A6P218_9PEZI|nr:Mechanosensitive ion channel-domain-containing protein [Lineolata rhizophorae]
MSGTHNGFSRQGFEPIPSPGTMSPTSKDATINIPLERVVSHGSAGGAGRVSSTAPITEQPRGGEEDMRSSEKSGGLFHRTRGRRRVRHANGSGQPGDALNLDGEERSLNRMGRIYNAILNFSIVTRYFIYVLPLALCIAVPIIIGATVAQDARIGTVQIVWFFVWIEVVWLSLWVSKIVAHFLPMIFQFLMGVVSPGTRKYALVLTALEIPLSLVGWAVTSLATFVPLMTRNPDARRRAEDDPAADDTLPWMVIVQKVLAASVVASLVFLGERFIIQLLSINYHRKQFNLKIKDSKRNVHLLGLLYDASRSLFPAYCNEFAEEDYIISDAINLKLGSKPGTSNGNSGSATPMRLLQDVGRFGDKITSAFGNVAHEITGKQVFNPNSAHSIVVEALEKNRSAEALAKRLWMSFVVEGREALYQEDIVEVLGENRREDAMECFGALDRDGNGDISLDEMILTVTEIGRERKSIATSMHDVDQAIGVLDNLLCAIAFVIVVFVFVAFLNSNFTTTLATAGTALLSMSFIFAATAQEVLGSCIFLFVKHPYDIGDRVDISGEFLTVEHISLLFTEFKRVANNKSVQIPNIVLNGLWIENVSRSKAMREQLTIPVNFDTSFDDVKTLKAEMQAFVLDKENSRDFLPEIEVEVLGLGDLNKLELAVEIRHKSNWANEAVRANRRSKFMCALVLALRKVPIYAPGGGSAGLGDPANPSYSVAISHEEAERNKASFADDKDAKRLFPQNKPASPAGECEGSAESRAIESLTQRPPAMDPARDDWGPRDDDTTAHRASLSSPGLPPGHGGADSGAATTTASERRSVDEMRGMLRRQSTRGKRRPGSDIEGASSASGPHGPGVGGGDGAGAGAQSLGGAYPGVPTIVEPAPPPSYSARAQQGGQQGSRSPPRGNAFAEQALRYQAPAPTPPPRGAPPQGPPPPTPPERRRPPYGGA